LPPNPARLPIKPRFCNVFPDKACLDTVGTPCAWPPPGSSRARDLYIRIHLRIHRRGRRGRRAPV